MTGTETFADAIRDCPIGYQKGVTLNGIYVGRSWARPDMVPGIDIHGHWFANRDGAYLWDDGEWHTSMGVDWEAGTTRGYFADAEAFIDLLYTTMIRMGLA